MRALLPLRFYRKCGIWSVLPVVPDYLVLMSERGRIQVFLSCGDDVKLLREYEIGDWG